MNQKKKVFKKIPKNLSSQVNQKELEMGIKEEAEHTNNKYVAEIISLHHLQEDPNYYTKLHKTFKKGGYNPVNVFDPTSRRPDPITRSATMQVEKERKSKEQGKLKQIGTEARYFRDNSPEEYKTKEFRDRLYNYEKGESKDSKTSKQRMALAFRDYHKGYFKDIPTAEKYLKYYKGADTKVDRSIADFMSAREKGDRTDPNYHYAKAHTNYTWDT